MGAVPRRRGGLGRHRHRRGPGVLRRRRHARRRRLGRHLARLVLGDPHGQLVRERARDLEADHRRGQRPLPRLRPHRREPVRLPDRRATGRRSACPRCASACRRSWGRCGSPSGSAGPTRWSCSSPATASMRTGPARSGWPGGSSRTTTCMAEARRARRPAAAGSSARGPGDQGDGRPGADACRGPTRSAWARRCAGSRPPPSRRRRGDDGRPGAGGCPTGRRAERENQALPRVGSLFGTTVRVTFRATLGTRTGRTRHAPRAQGPLRPLRRLRGRGRGRPDAVDQPLPLLPHRRGREPAADPLPGSRDDQPRLEQLPRARRRRAGRSTRPAKPPAAGARGPPARAC